MLMAHLYFKIPLIYLDFTPIASLCTKSIYKPSRFAYPSLYFVRFVIYPMSDRYRSFDLSIKVLGINLNKTFSRSSRPVLLIFCKICKKTLVLDSLSNKVASQVSITLSKETSAQVFFCEFEKFLRTHFLWSTPCGCLQFCKYICIKLFI